jgi:hypothetical protein
LWISCPNNESFSINVFGNFWVNWHVPYHVSHFSARVLEKTLENAGFEIVQRYTETPALLIAQSLLCRMFAKPGRPTRQMRNAMVIAPLMLAIRCLLFPVIFLANALGRGDDLIVISKI